MDTTTTTLVEQAHAALEAARRIDHIEMQSPPIVFRHAAKVLREWDGKRVALVDYIVAVRAAIAEDHVEANRLNVLVDRMDDAYCHWTGLGRYVGAPDSRRGAMQEFIKVVDLFGGDWVNPVRASLWASERHRNLVGRAHVEAHIEDAARRIANLTSEYFDDGMIEQFIAGATEQCPKCGEQILRGCGRHLAKHAART